MSVGSVCVRTVDVASPNESAYVAASRMNARNVGMLIVVDELARPIGIVTDRDLTIAVLAHGKDPLHTTVKDVMTSSPISVTEDTPLEEALSVMRKGPCRRLPVVSASGGRLVGVLSVHDILTRLADDFAQVRRLLEDENPGVLGRH